MHFLIRNDCFLYLRIKDRAKFLMSLVFPVLTSCGYFRLLVYYFHFQDCAKALNKLMRNLNNYEWESEKSLKSLSRLIGKNFDHWSEKNYKNNNFFSRFPKEYSISKKPTLYIDTSYFTSRKKKCKFSDLHRRGKNLIKNVDLYHSHITILK